MDHPTQSWSTSALDRQRSLAITTPLQSLEANKGHIGAQKYDVRAYCLYAIDQVILGMRAHRGEGMHVIEKALSQFIFVCEPDMSSESNGRLVEYVIEGLLNVRGRGPFVELLTAADESGRACRIRFAFTLLEAKDKGDESS